MRVAGQDGAGRSRGAESGPASRRRVHTDPERVEVALIMLSQLRMQVTGSEPGLDGHSSLSGIAQARCRGGERDSQRGREKRRMSQAGPEKRRIKATCEPRLLQGSAQAPGQHGCKDIKQAENRKGALKSAAPRPPACVEGHGTWLKYMHRDRLRW